MKEKIIQFFTEVTKEMKKVTWPHREELIDSTSVVLIVCGVIATFVYVVDIAVNKLLSAIL